MMISRIFFESEVSFPRTAKSDDGDCHPIRVPAAAAPPWPPSPSDDARCHFIARNQKIVKLTIFFAYSYLQVDIFAKFKTKAKLDDLVTQKNIFRKESNSCNNWRFLVSFGGA